MGHRRGSLGKLSLRVTHRTLQLTTIVSPAIRSYFCLASYRNFFVAFIRRSRAHLLRVAISRIDTRNRFLSLPSLINTKQVMLTSRSQSRRIDCTLPVGNLMERWYADQRVFKGGNCNRWALWRGLATIPFALTRCYPIVA